MVCKKAYSEIWGKPFLLRIAECGFGRAVSSFRNLQWAIRNWMFLPGLVKGSDVK
jgi:hypothetical protein